MKVRMLYIPRVNLPILGLVCRRAIARACSRLTLF